MSRTLFMNNKMRHRSSNFNETNPKDDMDRDICFKWKKFYEYILIEKFPDATLGDYRSQASQHEGGNLKLFDFGITECGADWKIGKDGLSMEEAIKNPNKAFDDEDGRENPYVGLMELADNGGSNIACRIISPDSKYCKTSPAPTKTTDRRAAAWGCGIGMLIGLQDVGQCSEYFDFDGLKDDLEDILYITEEFKSLSYLCAGQIISSFQCRFLENLETQNSVFKSLTLKRKELIDQKLYPLKLRVTAVLILTLLLLTFVYLIKSFR